MVGQGKTQGENNQTGETTKRGKKPEGENQKERNNQRVKTQKGKKPKREKKNQMVKTKR